MVSGTRPYNVSNVILPLVITSERRTSTCSDLAATSTLPEAATVSAGMLTNTPPPAFDEGDDDPPWPVPAREGLGHTYNEQGFAPPQGISFKLVLSI